MLSKTVICNGYITSNYSPDRVTIQIHDDKGNVILDLVTYPTIASVKRTFILSALKSQVEAVKLDNGKEYTYAVYVEAGGQKVCAQSFVFTA